MKIGWRSIFSIRAGLRDLRRIALAQERIAAALDRIADRVDPPDFPDSSPEDLKHTGPSFTRDEEQVRIQIYTEQCWRELGRAPTDDEVCGMLDGKGPGE